MFFNEPKIAGVIYVLAAVAAVSRLENVGVINFRIRLELSKLFWLQVIRKLSSFSATVAVALIYESYWALVVGMVVGAIVRVISTYVAHPFRPRLSTAKTQELVGFSKWVLATSIFSFLNEKSDDLMVGKFLGAGPLGIYTIGYEISNLTATELVAPISHALFPGYSKLATDSAALGWYYLRTVSVMALIALPVSVGIALVAPELVLVLLGEKWRSAIPIVHILAINGGLVAIFSPNISAQMALGRPRTNAAFFGARAALLVCALVVFVPQYGLLAAAWSQLLVSWLIIPASTYVIARALDVGLTAVFNAIWRPVVAMAGMIGVLTFVAPVWSGSHPVITLFGKASLGASVYALMIYLMWRWRGYPDGAEAYVLRRLRNIFARLSVGAVS